MSQMAVMNARQRANNGYNFFFQFYMIVTVFAWFSIYNESDKHR